MKTINNDQLSIQVSSHGAELCSIIAHSTEYLWQADPAFWKRHSPILFPIVGSVWEDKYQHEGHSYSLTQHGFARDKEFELILDQPNEVRYRLTDDAETLAHYPFPFSLEIGYRIIGQQIEVNWQVTNTGHKEMYFQIGAHPAFNYPDFCSETKERGYFGFNCPTPTYLLISEKGCADIHTSHPLKLTDGLLPIDIHTFDQDALILENNQLHHVTLYDRENRPHLTLRFTAPVVGLWSPPSKNAPFVCIEPWYGRCDCVGYKGEYSQRAWMEHLAVGDTFRGGYIIEIHPTVG